MLKRVKKTVDLYTWSFFVNACRGKSDRKGTTTAAQAHTIICSSSVQDSMAPQHLTIWKQGAYDHSKKMVISSPPASSLCAGSSSAWSEFSTDTNDSQWLPDITSNFLLALAFSFSYFVVKPWIWIRLALILGHGIAASLSLSRCQIKAFMWAVLLIAVNCYRLVKIGISHWPTRMPKYLQVIIVVFMFVKIDLFSSCFS